MQLDYYLWKNKIKKQDFAAEIGVTPGNLIQIENKKVTPKTNMALKIMIASKGKVMPSDLLKEKDLLEIKKLEAKHKVYIKNLNINVQRGLKIRKNTGEIFETAL